MFRKGQEAFIASEEAFIVWEPESQTETFIRTANFKGKGADFGFIVPTPTEPELSEVGNGVFDVLRAILNSRTPPPRAAGGPGGKGGFGGGGGHVEIIKEQTVAGMKATVLKATDTRALELWLSNNQYPASPTVMRWTEYYVQNGYYLTAFKIDRKMESDAIKTSAVKMTFRTKIPFYPYREPASNRQQKGRTLAVYFLAPWNARARYLNTQVPWEARRTASGKLEPGEVKGLVANAKLAPEHTPGTPVLTYFLDVNELRPDYDVAFERRD